MKPLSRAFARLVLLFFALGIFFLAVNELIPYRTLGDRYRVMDTAYWIKNTLRITGIVLLVNGGDPVGPKPPLPILRPWVCHAMVAEGGKALL